MICLCIAVDAESGLLLTAAVVEAASVGSDEVLILSYPRYCRYRAALCRLNADLQSDSSVVDCLSPRLLAAVGLTADLPCVHSTPVSTTPVHPRVLFCRSTVVHPALHKHAFRLDELGIYM